MGKRDNLKWNLLLGGAADLLPLQGDEIAAGFLGRDRVHLVRSAPGPVLNHNLALNLVASANERGPHHRFKHLAGGGVAGTHRFLTASTSRAGVRSPLQLMRRGAWRKRKRNPSLR